MKKPVCVSDGVCCSVFTRACVSAPAKPTQRPQAVLGHGGVAMVTHRSITIHTPACFYSDDNGPIERIQVIVAESGGMTLQKHLTAITLGWIHLGFGLFVTLTSNRIMFYSMPLCAKLTNDTV